ncbi:hypothetical protein IW140_002771 [Coemansia sp. RSA 1813]|nr:hypothetical protein EV178_003651 [Coemansia sp. RSA 1646]KAJ1766232.1 hypothetical protein LPJ74_005978 [Coemansia sp. RSA 1843]KAJ2088366.1 hypothetical protein IW138_004242 [Coemansia sp. RSA 986]KAJ2213806.1 hypothetical protein EV179_003505 [Coemansia sp. RSA 487]KAJ2569883.1 hypothetical protein IW140_002771 [Coemansia sp. RSA 1813]
MSKGAPFDLTEDEQVPDLYAVLEVQKTADDDELRKAYRRRALRTHPDKWAHLDPSSPEAQAKTQEFQQVGFAYTILKDPKRRKMYDTTGSINDLVVEEGKDWDAYFRELWSGVVDATTIEQFALKYKRSDEEKADLLAAYTRHDGDLDLIFADVMLADVELDEERFVGILEDAIKAKTIKRTKIFTKSKKLSKKRAAQARGEAAEADALREELGLDDKLRKAKNAERKRKRKRGGDDDDDSDAEGIKALIRQNTNNRMSAIIANIEEKYVSQQNSKKKKKSDPKSKESGKSNKKKNAADAFDEPSEEEFLALQAKLFGKK